ncbi:MAG TPA: ATP-binding protein [Aggregatilinea sp.]|uniref:ATP-binding protein n=1 Tax=Aggregatilinea sp. TaxID=2806333 RepID=UPI002C2D8E34|nr:ATP-binding protein [Aggregatilinea sp.]HML24569.1 ATP-binding protein [Aggregatilinea sp.]
MGYVTHDVPLDHPHFGKAFPCVCQQETIAARRNTRLREMSNLSAVADKTFDSFLLDLPGFNESQLSTLRAAHSLALDYAHNPQGWLLFQGTYGSGKTHLAAAIANEVLARGQDVIFITTPDLLDHLRSTFGPDSNVEYDDLFEQVRATRLLILDDLGAESPTAWAQEKLYQLINHRYLNRLNTVITTNVEPENIDPRVRSRLMDHHLTRPINLNVPDFRAAAPLPEQSPISGLNLYGDMVFETFDLRQGDLVPKDRHNLQEAYDIALSYAKDPDGWLTLMGGSGCGKTHLAAAIANYRARLDEPAILVTASDLLDYLRAAFGPSSSTSYDKRFAELKSIPMLVIDQLDLTNPSPWALEKLRQIVNHRYVARLPTVFTTAQEFATLDPVIRSRLADTRRSHVFLITAPDYKGGGRRYPGY